MYRPIIGKQNPSIGNPIKTAMIQTNYMQSNKEQRKTFQTANDSNVDYRAVDKKHNPIKKNSVVNASSI